ncbi:MAG: hypothetical protein RLY86_2383 [Pseudomonadota bacterium]
MAWIQNQPLGRRIFALVAGLLLAITIVALTGRSALDALYEDSRQLNARWEHMFASSRATSNLLSFARAAEGAVIAEDEGARAASASAADDELSLLRDRLAALGQDADPMIRAELQQVSRALEAVVTAHEDAAALARQGDREAARARLAEAMPQVAVARDHFRKIEAHDHTRTEAALTAVSQTRVSGLTTMAVTAFLAVLIGLGVAWIVVRQITRPIALLTGIMDRLAAGDDDVTVPETGCRDEIGRMQTAMVALGRTVAESFRLKQMVDDMPINVMLADPNDGFRITYVNRMTQETMRRIEHLVPVKADAMIGQSVDIFHKNPAHQHRILKDPANLPWKAKIRLSDETMDLRIAPVRDRKGNYVGAMLNWSLVTQQVRMTADFEQSVKAVVETVAAAATELEASAQSMSVTAEETNRQSTVVAAAAEQASANVQTVAAAAEELSASITEISKQVSHSSRIAAKGAEEAQATRDVVDGLAQSAQKIGEVVDLISSIANQTNLLALNATIEAARAGEAGKGFAVVASEVKALAQQTQKATEEIASQIGAIQSASTSSVDAIRRITDVIGEVNQIASAIAAAIEEQGAATREIARNVEQAAQGTHEVSANIGSVTTAAAEAGAAASQVAGSSGELSRQSALLSRQVDRFLEEMRAA